MKRGRLVSRSAAAFVLVAALAPALPVSAQEAVPDSADTGAPAEDTKITAGYEKNGWNGFWIGSEDGEFRLNIGAYTQVRYNMNWRTRPDTAHADERDFTRGWSVPRTRFILDGNFTSNVYYHLRANINAASDFEMIAAFAQVGLGEKWNVRVGRQWLALSREDWMFPQDLPSIEFSANNFTYAIWSSLGVQTRFQTEKTRLWLALSNGAFGGRQGFPAAPEASDGMLSSRLEVQLSGEDWSVWDDLVGRRGRASGILLGMSGAYQVRDKTSTAYRDAAQLNLDVGFNGDGYNLFFAGSWTTREAQGGTWSNVYGIVGQGTYFVSDHTYLYGRFDGVLTGTAPEASEDFTSYSAGVGWLPFLWTNRWKVNAEVGYLPQVLNDTLVEPSGMLGFLSSDERNQWTLRLQFQFGF
jgi:hypothetical protein